jgi:peptide/histidine transporter 3/4
MKKWKLEMPRDGEEELYNVHAKDCSMNGNRKILHTDGFK